MIVKWVILSLYGLMIIVIGIMGLKKTKTFSDFFLGGGNIGPWMSAFTYGTAYFSAVLFIGFAGKIGWDFGYSSLLITAGNAFIGVLAVWWLLGYRIKKMSLEYRVSTMPEFFEARYNSKFLKFFSSLVSFVFLVPYSAAVFIGLSYLFKSNFNIEYWQALIFMGLFTAIYLTLGGYKSMTTIDVIFGIIMTLGVFILLFSTIQKGNGLFEITKTLRSIDPKLVSIIGPPGLWNLFCLIVLTSIAPFAMPQLVQKFYAIKDKRSIKIGMIVSTIFALIISGIAYFTGSTIKIFLNPQNAPDAFINGKPVFDALMPEFLTTAVPGSLSVVLLILMLSASMSTLAALVLISSSTISKDMYAGFINKNVSDKNLMLLMRVLSIVFIFISIIIAYFRPSTIVSILGVSWGAIGSAFLGPFVWGLLYKKTNKSGAISSSLLGLSSCLFLYFYGFSSPESGTIGMIVSFTTTPLFSVLYDYLKFHNTNRSNIFKTISVEERGQ